jgi:zinc D-Ala-D-Ala carboxypeptidase
MCCVRALVWCSIWLPQMRNTYCVCPDSIKGGIVSIQLPGISQPRQSTDPIYNGSHFTWGEATNNFTRLPQDTEFEGVIIPAAQITSNIIKLAYKLDDVRVLFGDRPVIITSWLRPSRTNRAVGGVRNSQHLLGWAADFIVRGIDPHDVAAKLPPDMFGGLGDSSAFTHGDLRQLMGWSSARWDYGFA